MSKRVYIKLNIDEARNELKSTFHLRFQLDKQAIYDRDRVKFQRKESLSQLNRMLDASQSIEKY